MSKTYQPKIKYKGGASQNPKIETVGNRKKLFFQLFHFRNSEFFIYALVQKILNVSLEDSLTVFENYLI